MLVSILGVKQWEYTIYVIHANIHTLQGTSNAQKTIFSCQVHGEHVCKNIHIFKYTKNIFSQVHGEQGPNSVHENL